MLNQPVPDYFQEDTEEALRSRAQWLATELSWRQPFFAQLLQTDEPTFAGWQAHQATLSAEQLQTLRELWEMMLHVLSFVNFDLGRARQLLEHVPAPQTPGREESDTVAWSGSSIQAYLQAHGRKAVAEVNYWITSFRFGAPLPGP
jgi:hypothetical protein